MAVEQVSFPKNTQLALNDAAEYLGISPKTLRNKIFSGKAPRHVKRFGRLYFLVIDLDAFLEQEGRVREAYTKGSA